MQPLLATIFRKPKNKLQKKRKTKRETDKKNTDEGNKKDVVKQAIAKIRSAAFAGVCGLATTGGFAAAAAVGIAMVASDNDDSNVPQCAPDVAPGTLSTVGAAPRPVATTDNPHEPHPPPHIYPFVARVNDRGEVIDFQSSGDIEQWVDAFYEMDRRASALSATPAFNAHRPLRRTPRRSASEGCTHRSDSDASRDA